MSDILHILPAEPFGGAQRLALDLAATQRGSGRDVGIVWTNRGDRARQAAEQAGVPFDFAGEGVERVTAVKQLAREAGSVHLHLAPPWIGLALPRRSCVVLHLHVRPSLTVHEPSVRRRIDAFAERSLLNRADRLIAISEWVSEAWQEEYPAIADKIDVVFNGIPLPPVLGRQDVSGRPLTVGVACRLSDRKGIEEFIRLAVAIRERSPEVAFRVAGDGPMRGRYEEMAADAGLGEAMRFDGFVGDMAGFWAGVDLAAFTPPFEPFGLRLIEPISFGLPVLAYKNGSGSDEVIARCRGVAATPYEDRDALADIAVDLSQRPDERQRLSEAGLSDVREHFSIEAMTRAVDAVYVRARGA
ncbi:MAG: glycosyltransferase family 4 protein [Pseudomonadota bacterium]